MWSTLWSTTAWRPASGSTSTCSCPSPSPSSPPPSSSSTCLWSSQTGYTPIKVFYHHFHHFNPFHPISSSLVSLSIMSMENPVVSLMPWPNLSKTVIWSEIKAEIILHVFICLGILNLPDEGFSAKWVKIFKTRMSLTHPHHLIHLSFIPRFQNFRLFYFYFYSPTLLLLDSFEVKPLYLSLISFKHERSNSR